MRQRSPHLQCVTHLRQEPLGISGANPRPTYGPRCTRETRLAWARPDQNRARSPSPTRRPQGTLCQSIKVG
jgi:hypothetical protein